MDYFYGNVFSRPKGHVKRIEARLLKEETVEEIVKSAWEKAKIASIDPSLVAQTRAVHANMHTTYSGS